MRVVERLKMKKCLAVLLALCLLFPFGNVVLAEQNQKEAGVSESEVIEFAKEFVDETYQSLRPMEFKEIEEKYLKPDNELFNIEMDIRNAVDHSIIKDFSDNGLEVILFKHEFKNIVLKEQFLNKYRIYINFSEIWELSEHEFGSKDPERTPQGINYEVIVTVENDEGRLYITDLNGINDPVSLKLNKDTREPKPLSDEFLVKLNKGSSKEEYYLNASEPNGISPKKMQDESTGEVAEKIYNTPEELKKAQLQNLANLKEELTAPAAMRLDEDNTKPDITPMAASYSLDYAKCGAWARTFAQVAPKDYAKATNYRFIHLETLGGNAFDCANFASQVVYAGCRVFKDTGYPTTSWYAYNNGRTQSTCWAYAKNLCRFVNSNTGKGPYSWRKTWMNYNNKDDNTLYPGDLVFICGDRNGEPFHTLAVSEEGGRNRALYCAHSDPVRSGSLGQRIARQKNYWFYGINLKYRK